MNGRAPTPHVTQFGEQNSSSPARANTSHLVCDKYASQLRAWSQAIRDKVRIAVNGALRPPAEQPRRNSAD